MSTVNWGGVVGAEALLGASLLTLGGGGGPWTFEKSESRYSVHGVGWYKVTLVSRLYRCREFRVQSLFEPTINKTGKPTGIAL